VFNWVATMWRGSMTFETPMLFAVGGVILFTIGGFSGLMLAITPADFQYQDTYFVVAHFHYVIFGASIFALFGAIYYWLPKWTGHMYSETAGKWHFWLTTIGMNLTFFPQHFLGLAGMPRRIPDYALQFTEFNQMSTVGAFLTIGSQLIFFYVAFKAIKGGQKATTQVWDGAEGLEWTVPSPAPYHTFATPPRVK
jgi:cytochrome c oxidase subunit 1